MFRNDLETAPVSLKLQKECVTPVKAELGEISVKAEVEETPAEGTSKVHIPPYEPHLLTNHFFALHRLLHHQIPPTAFHSPLFPLFPTTPRPSLLTPFQPPTSFQLSIPPDLNNHSAKHLDFHTRPRSIDSFMRQHSPSTPRRSNPPSTSSLKQDSHLSPFHLPCNLSPPFQPDRSGESLHDKLTESRKRTFWTSISENTSEKESDFFDDEEDRTKFKKRVKRKFSGVNNYREIHKIAMKEETYLDESQSQLKKEPSENQESEAESKFKRLNERSQKSGKRVPENEDDSQNEAKNRRPNKAKKSEVQQLERGDQSNDSTLDRSTIQFSYETTSCKSLSSNSRNEASRQTPDALQAHTSSRKRPSVSRKKQADANARERNRVHTISEAFEALRKALPTFQTSPGHPRPSKLAVLRVACSYIVALLRLDQFKDRYPFSDDESGEDSADGGEAADGEDAADGGEGGKGGNGGGWVGGENHGGDCFSGEELGKRRRGGVGGVCNEIENVNKTDCEDMIARHECLKTELEKKEYFGKKDDGKMIIEEDKDGEEERWRSELRRCVDVCSRTIREEVKGVKAL